MKSTLIVISVTFACLPSFSQNVTIDFANKKAKTIQIETGIKAIKIENKLQNCDYSFIWKKERLAIPKLSIAGSDHAIDLTCSDQVENILDKISTETIEENMKKHIEEARKLLRDGSISDKCLKLLNTAINSSDTTILLPFSIAVNERITFTVKRKSSIAGEDSTSWSYTFETPQKSRWLTHYGLTYASSAISKTTQYYAQADTSTANRYTISGENDGGPKPWENISVTANFTYPFHSDNRGFDGGFTAGFGLSAGFELSGHAGLSMVIGQNVIIGSGIGFMQKYKIKGAYREGQVIKENLGFEALHKKVWLPELNFTIGFRFGSNPFGKKASTESTTSGGGNQGSE